jgi:hypothetical protein
MENSFNTELETPELESLSSLAQHLVYRLPGCDDEMIRLTLREVYRDFCRRACCLRVRRRFSEPICRIPIVYGGTILQVTEVRDGSHILHSPYEYRYNGEIISIPRLRDGCVEVSWIEIPSLSSENAPKWLIDKYGDALCSGVLGRLYSMSGKAWSDPQMAVIEGQRYEAVVNQVCAQLYSVDGSGKLGSVYDTSDLI